MFLRRLKHWLTLLIIFNINNNMNFLNQRQSINYPSQIKGHSLYNKFYDLIKNQQYFLLQVLMQKPRWEWMKELCVNQSNQFKDWNEKKAFSQFHSSHYDWWAFPINRNSSYGNKYKVFWEDKELLENDKQFISALRKNAILVCRSWGYDLQRGEDIKQKDVDQCWQDWPIRLYKLTNSLEYFNQEDLFINAIKYGLTLIEAGSQFSYGPKDLKPLFFNNKYKIEGKGQQQKKQQKQLQENTNRLIVEKKNQE